MHTLTPTFVEIYLKMTNYTDLITKPHFAVFLYFYISSYGYDAGSYTVLI